MVAIERRQGPMTTTSLATAAAATIAAAAAAAGASTSNSLQQRQQLEQEQQQHKQHHQQQQQEDHQQHPQQHSQQHPPEHHQQHPQQHPQQHSQQQHPHEHHQQHPQQQHLPQQRHHHSKSISCHSLICTKSIAGAKQHHSRMSQHELEGSISALKKQPSTTTTATMSAITKSAAGGQAKKSSNMKDNRSQDAATKKMLKLDLSSKELDEFSLKSPKSPISARLPHQSSLSSSVDVEDRKTLREALYQGIFHRHRRSIFAVGSFLRMLRSRNSQYNTIRSTSEADDLEEVR